LLRWNFTTGARIQSSASIGDDGTVFFGSDDNYVYAVHGQNGTLKWKYLTGDLVYSSPTIGGNGMVYVGSADNNVYALDEQSGTLLWSHTCGADVYSSVAISADKTFVVVGSYDFVLYALDSLTGVLLWTFSVGAATTSSAAIATSDGSIYVGSDSMFVYALSPAGAQKWKFSTGGRVFSSPSIEPDDSVIYASSYEDNTVHAIHNTGASKWFFTTSGSVFSSVTIGDTLVYVASYDKNLYALNKQTGIPQWTFTTGDLIYSSPIIGLNDSTVFVGSYDHNLYALDKLTGALKWTFTTGDSIVASPSLTDDGDLFIGASDGVLYCLSYCSPLVSPTSTLTTTTTPTLTTSITTSPTSLFLSPSKSLSRNPTSSSPSLSSSEFTTSQSIFPTTSLMPTTSPSSKKHRQRINVINPVCDNPSDVLCPSNDCKSDASKCTGKIDPSNREVVPTTAVIKDSTAPTVINVLLDTGGSKSLGATFFFPPKTLLKGWTVRIKQASKTSIQKAEVDDSCGQKKELVSSPFQLLIEDEDGKEVHQLRNTISLSSFALIKDEKQKRKTCFGYIQDGESSSSSWKCVQSDDYNVKDTQTRTIKFASGTTDHLTTFAVLLGVTRRSSCDGVGWIVITASSMIGAALVLITCVVIVFCYSRRFRALVYGYSVDRGISMVVNKIDVAT